MFDLTDDSQPASPEVTTGADLEAAEKIATKIITWQDEIKEREEAIKHAKATLHAKYGDGKTQFGEFEVNSYTNRRFDAATAKKNLPAESYEKITVVKADATRAKANLTEEELELTKKTFGTITTVNLRED